MRRYIPAVLVAAALQLAGAAAWAQAPGPGSVVAQGFTVEILLAQLSLYLPVEATQGLGGFGRGFGGQGGARAGAQGGGQGSTQGGTAQGSTTQGDTAQGTAAGGRAGQNFRQLFQFTRDAKLYLTRDQIAKLIPILQDLRANPLPTPSKAKTVQASVDGILSVAQKAEFTDYKNQMQKAIEQIRKQFAASSGGQGGTGAQGGTFRQGDTGQAGVGQAGAAGGQGARQGAQLTPTERRQRELDAFIKVLQDRQKQVSA